MLTSLGPARSLVQRLGDAPPAYAETYLSETALSNFGGRARACRSAASECPTPPNLIGASRRGRAFDFEKGTRDDSLVEVPLGPRLNLTEAVFGRDLANPQDWPAPRRRRIFWWRDSLLSQPGGRRPAWPDP